MKFWDKIKLSKNTTDGRLYKLVNLVKLFRILKLIKDKGRVFKLIRFKCRLGFGVDRLLFFLIVFVIVCHVGTCLWLIIAFAVNDYDNEYKGTWLSEYFETYGKDSTSLYYISLYWTITTITNVGYGDISGTNNIERFFTIIMVLMGVILFSTTTGSLTSIITNADNSDSKYQEKLNILNKMYKDY